MRLRARVEMLEKEMLSMGALAESLHNRLKELEPEPGEPIYFGPEHAAEVRRRREDTKRKNWESVAGM